MRGLALDLGGITGWACDNPDGSVVPLAGIWDCSHTGSVLGPAYRKLAENVVSAVEKYRLDYIACEAAITPMWGKTNMATSRKLLGMAAIVELTADSLGLKCYDVHLGSARKHFVGNARALKSDVIRRCQILDWPAVDPNACDALCVLAYSRACFGQLEILGKVL